MVAEGRGAKWRIRILAQKYERRMQRLMENAVNRRASEFSQTGEINGFVG